MAITLSELGGYYEKAQIEEPTPTLNPTEAFTEVTYLLDHHYLSSEWIDHPTLPNTDDIRILALTQAPVSLQLKVNINNNNHAKPTVGEVLEHIRTERHQNQQNFTVLNGFHTFLKDLKRSVTIAENHTKRQECLTDLLRLKGRLYMELAITERLMHQTGQLSPIQGEINQLEESINNFNTAAQIGLETNDLDLLAMVSIHTSKAYLYKRFFDTALEFSCAGYSIASTVRRPGDMDWFAESLLQTMVARYGLKTVFYFIKLYNKESYFREGVNKAAVKRAKAKTYPKRP